MKSRIMNLVMPILPKNDLSHWVGRFVHRRLPGPLGRKSVEWFAQYYKINMDEAEYPLEHYRSIGALFTRRLKPGVRPIGPGLVHPADALITECGEISKLKLIQAKGKDYTVPELIRNSSWAAGFEGGTFLTYYLCPTDYHRVHAPVDGKLTWCCHVPGEMWPVNEWSVNAITNLFALNERVIAGFETPKGRVALVMVAATNVGNMSMSFDENIVTNVRATERAVKEKCYSPGKDLHRGDEVGVFNMGSTVIMLYEKGMLPPSVCERLRGAHVKMGESVLVH